MKETVDEKPVFDKKDLMDRLDYDQSLAVELAEIFIADVREKIVALKAAVKEKNSADIEKEGHSLKGAASNISGERVRHIAGVIEAAGKNNDLAGAVAALAVLGPAVDDLIDALKAQVVAPGGE